MTSNYLSQEQDFCHCVFISRPYNSRKSTFCANFFILIELMTTAAFSSGVTVKPISSTFCAGIEKRSACNLPADITKSDYLHRKAAQHGAKEITTKRARRSYASIIIR